MLIHLFFIYMRDIERGKISLENSRMVFRLHEEKAEVLWDFYTDLIGSREERPCTLDLDELGLAA
jgi:hypothetical protein